MVVNYRDVVVSFHYSTEFRLRICRRMLDGVRGALPAPAKLSAPLVVCRQTGTAAK